jgi:hypothetical protein
LGFEGGFRELPLPQWAWVELPLPSSYFGVFCFFLEGGMHRKLYIIGWYLRKGGFLELPLPSPLCGVMFIIMIIVICFFKAFIWMVLHKLMASYEYIIRVVLGWGDLPGLWHIIMLSFF